MTIKNITILGIGAMGSRIAKNLLNADYNISIYNRTEKSAVELIQLGANYFDTPIQAVSDADLVISMLTDDQAAIHVWLDEEVGAISGMKAGAIAIESSTLSINCIANLSEAFDQKNISFLDAPVLGSRPQAEAAALIFLIGGDKKVLQKVKPLLEQLSSATYHLGKSGHGAAMKLAVNAYFSSQVAALSEVLALMQKLDISKAQTVELFNQLPTTSPALQGIGELIASENFQPFFPINLVEKDLGYVKNFALQKNMEIPTISATHTSFQSAIEKGFGEDNIAGLAQLW